MLSTSLSHPGAPRCREGAVFAKTAQHPAALGLTWPLPHCPPGHDGAPGASQRGYLCPSWRRAHPASPCPVQDGGTSWSCRGARGKLLGSWQGCGCGHMPAPAIWLSAGGQWRCAWHRRTHWLSHRHQGPLPTAQGQIRAPQEGTRGRMGRASPGSPACTTGRWLRCFMGKEGAGPGGKQKDEAGGCRAVRLPPSRVKPSCRAMAFPSAPESAASRFH